MSLVFIQSLHFFCKGLDSLRLHVHDMYVQLFRAVQLCHGSMKGAMNDM